MTEFLDGKYSVGQRVMDADDFCGTVQYIGPVASAKKAADIWLGVEWDRNSRGKHDGSCVDANEVTHRYFTCPPGSGSFVKPSKISAGRTFTSALLERYVALDAPLITDSEGGHNTLPDSYVVTATGAHKAIEFVGEQMLRKRQQLCDALEVSVRGCGVSSGGEKLAELAGHVELVDLQHNLLSCWGDVKDITRHLPRLTTLMLHGNRLGDIFLDDVESFEGHFSQVSVLALNLCNIGSWSTVQTLHHLLPSLTELYLAANSGLGKGLTALSASFFPLLTVLDLSSCGLLSWAAVAGACGQLQSLEALVLDCNTGLEEVQENQEGNFSRLTRLSLASTNIQSWAHVNSLCSYPSLTSLRLTNIPLFAHKGASEVRPEVIARVTNLVVFNGSSISSKERTDAEKAYLRTMMHQKRIIDHPDSSEGEKKKEEEDSFSLMNPRFAALSDLHGADLLPMGEGPGSGLASMASDMVQVTLHNLSFAAGGSLEPVSRKLPASLKVERLRLMVKQLFGLETHQQQLSVRQYKGAVPTLLDQDSASIGYFGAVDGADIFINEAK